MIIYIDTEFNEFQGELISMALFTECGAEFYEVLPCPNPGAWVAEHVMPILGKEPIHKQVFQLRLQHWLKQFSSVHVVADWPEDIHHFCQSLITGPGMRIDTPRLTMEIRRDLDAVSAMPHNALADARAIRDRALLIQFSDAYTDALIGGRAEEPPTRSAPAFLGDEADVIRVGEPKDDEAR